MALRTTYRNPARRLAASAGVAMLLTLGLACGGDNETDTPTTTVPATETTVLVKNRPLNNCVSVMSGERPAAGVTVPRCTPSNTVVRR